MAILLDATIVRGILLPSTLALLGERTWYLPRWLSWIPDRSRPEQTGEPMADATAPKSPALSPR